MPETRAMFDRLADRYDEVIPFFGAFAAQLTEALDLPAGTRLLDVGTGRGAIALAAAGRGCVVTAVDGAPRMVELLRAARPALDVRLMDAHALDLPDGAFDAVTLGFVIHVVRDPARVLSEVRRVLRPGGLVALTTPGPASETGRWAAFNLIIGEYEVRSDPVRGVARRLDVPAALAAAGFTGVRRRAIEVHLPVAGPQACWDFHMSHGFAGFVESLSPADAADLRARALAELARMHADGGIVLDRAAAVDLGYAPPAGKPGAAGPRPLPQSAG